MEPSTNNSETSWINTVIFILAIMGIALSTFLWNAQITEINIPCTTGGCEDVLRSDFGKIFGVPMAVFGVFYYTVVALLAFQRFFIKHKLLDRLLLVAIIWGIIFSLYLRYLEFFKIQSICAWCWGSVGIIILMTISYFIERSSAKFDNK